MEIAYRTLVLKYDLLRLSPETAEKIPKLLKVQEEFRRWATEWALSGGSLPPPDHNPLKYFAMKFLYADKTLDWFKGLKKNGIKVKKMRPPLVFDAQLRLSKERDIGRGVFVDLPKREVRVRKWSGKRGETIVLPLGDKAVKWILARVKEGGGLTLATVWIGASRRNSVMKLYVTLVFRREVAPMEVKRLLVVDFNALHNGLSWAVVEERRIVTKGILRPNVSKIAHMQKVASKLDSVCAKKDKACDGAMAAKSRVWRLLRSWEDEAAKKLAHSALQYRAAIVADAPFDQSIKELKEGGYTSEKKIFLNFGRLRQRLRGLAEWYGVPYREERLYSTLCPRCGRKMEELPNRRVRCACGFEANRDEVPAFWAMKLYPQLVSLF
jgi:putative transposase